MELNHGSRTIGEHKWKEKQILGSCQIAEKNCENKGHGDTNCNLFA